ncbi:MAG: LptA/OstA family protein [Candidatus Margulisiibacteriota bacterium]
MEENLPWKVIFFGTFFSLVILAGAYFLIAPGNNDYFSEVSTDKIAEFKNPHIIGKKDGKPSWELAAESGWLGKDKETTNLINLKDGKIFQNEKIVLNNLSAPRAKANLRSKIIEAFGLAENEDSKKPSHLNVQIDLENVAEPNANQPEDWANLKADYLKYFSNEKRSEIRGRINLQKKDGTVMADSMNLNNENKIADISGHISFIRSNGTVRADNMRFYGKEERLDAIGNVVVAVSGESQATKIKAASANFFEDTSKDMQLHGSIEALQSEKIVIGNEAIYSQNSKTLTIKGAVKAVFGKAGVIIKSNTAEKLHSNEAKEMLKEKTLLTSNELLLSTNIGDAKASGNVEVTQKGREAKADYAFYNDKTEILSLTGNVYMKQGDKWVKAKQVNVSVKNETFEAVGSVEAEFRL